MISAKDRDILRELAKRQLELANAPHNRALEALWLRHNTLRGERPTVRVEMETFEQEILPPLMRCEGEEARALEHSLLRLTLNQTILEDDTPVPDYYPVRPGGYFHLFGYEIEKTTAVDSQGNSLGHQFQHVIGDLHDDFEKLGPSVYGVDEAGAAARMAQAESVFGDILPVRKTMAALYAVPTQLVVHLMGMENMYFAMADYPDEFSQMMDRIAGDYIAYFRLLEAGGHLLPTTGSQPLAQGSFCYTDELPAAPPLTTRDVWGFLDSQETVGISPAMFEEFIFPAYRRIAQKYGLLSYGCCEPVDPVWNCLSTLGNLRKVSISPWCNEELMGERLRGSATIFHRKPSPNLLGVEEVLDEDAARQSMRKTLAAAKGCKLEIVQRDVYTVHNNPAKARRYVQLMRECIEQDWQA